MAQKEGVWGEGLVNFELLCRNVKKAILIFSLKKLKSLISPHAHGNIVSI